MRLTVLAALEEILALLASCRAEQARQKLVALITALKVRGAT